MIIDVLIVAIAGLLLLGAFFGYVIRRRRGTTGLTSRGLDPQTAAKLGYRGPQLPGAGDASARRDVYDPGPR
jgi:hypothetical protein